MSAIYAQFVSLSGLEFTPYTSIFDPIQILSIMNKAQLISKIAEDAGITNAQASKALGAVINGVTSTLESGDKLTLVGFGTFSTSERAARKGRNPRTGETLNIAARKVVRFKAGKELAGRVNS